MKNAPSAITRNNAGLAARNIYENGMRKKNDYYMKCILKMYTCVCARRAQDTCHNTIQNSVTTTNQMTDGKANQKCCFVSFNEMKTKQQMCTSLDRNDCD